MIEQPLVITKDQAEIVEILNTLYQGYETAANQSQVRTLIYSNLSQLQKQIQQDSEDHE